MFLLRLMKIVFLLFFVGICLFGCGFKEFHIKDFELAENKTGSIILLK